MRTTKIIGLFCLCRKGWMQQIISLLTSDDSAGLADPCLHRDAAQLSWCHTDVLYFSLHVVFCLLFCFLTWAKCFFSISSLSVVPVYLYLFVVFPVHEVRVIFLFMHSSMASLFFFIWLFLVCFHVIKWSGVFQFIVCASTLESSV